MFLMVIDFIVESDTQKNSLENIYVSSLPISHGCVSMSLENCRDFFQACDLKRNQPDMGFYCTRMDRH